MSGAGLHITIVQGSILEVEAQVIVNAANSLGIMGGGVAGVIRSFLPKALRTVVLVDVEPAMVDAWSDALRARGYG